MTNKRKLRKIIVLLVSLCIFLGAVPFEAFAEAPLLSALSLDGGYDLDFSPGKLNYTVQIPQGHPRIPRITANAGAGASVKVYNAAMPEEAEAATAYVVVTKGDEKSQYTIDFIKNEEIGFTLQFDDRYTFTPQTLTPVSFTTSDTSVTAVNSSGVVTVRKAQDRRVTITAIAADGQTEDLIIDKTEKAQVDLIMSVGQSNAYGTGGNGSAAVKIKPGTGYDMGYDGDTQQDNYNTSPIPLGNTENGGQGVSGVRQAFTNKWYELTGEKTLFINAADPGIPISAWQKEGATYKGAKKEYDRVKGLMQSSDFFEVYRTFYYFNHGSADVGGNYNQNYYQHVENTLNLLRDECDMEFGSIFEYFASTSDYTAYARATHYALSYDIEDIYMSAVIKEAIHRDGSLLAGDNLHLTQAGHDYCGDVLAEGTFAQALHPDGKISQSSANLNPAESPEVELTGAELTDGKNINPLYLGDSRDWLAEFTIKLSPNVEKYVLFKGTDTEIAIEPKAKARGITMSTPSGRITFSACDANDFYEENTWRIYYDDELGLIYLYKNNDIQSNEIYSGPVTISTVGQLGGSSQADLKSVKIWHGEKSVESSAYEFKGSLDEKGVGTALEFEGGKMLWFAKSKYVLSGADKIRLSKDKDWSVETYAAVSKDISLLGTADNTSNLFVNLNIGGFRVRYSSDGYVDLLCNVEDFRELHKWTLKFSASEKKIRLYRDDIQVSEGNLDADFTFDQMGFSGSTGDDNNAYIDYMDIRQDGIHKNGSDTIRFDFEEKLSDSSSDYEFNTASGSEKYIDRPAKNKGTRLRFNASNYTLNEPIRLNKDSDWSFETYALVNNEIALLGSADNTSNFYVNRGHGFRLRYSGSGFVDINCRVADFDMFHKWTFTYSAEAKKLMVYMDDTLIETADFSHDFVFTQMGFSGTTGTSNNAQIDYIEVKQNGINKNGSNSIRFDFENSLKDNTGGYVLTRADGSTSFVDSYNPEEGSAIQFTNDNYIVDEIKLAKEKDWSFETYGTVTGEISLLGTPDNTSNLYVNLGHGFRLRYSANGYVDFICNLADFKTFHKWRMDYSASEKKVKLYKDDVFVTEQGFYQDLAFTQVGYSGNTGLSNNATLAYMKISQEGVNKNGSDTIRFDFENNLTDRSGEYTLALQSGSTKYQLLGASYPYTVSKALVFASSNYRANNTISLSADKDWSFETYCTFTRDVALLGTPDNSNNIYINVGDQGFRIRYSSAGYASLKGTPGDFSSLHKWRIDYSASERKLRLYRDDVLVDEDNFSYNLNLTQMGFSGDPGSDNTGFMDYMYITQDGVNKNGSDNIRFDFEDSLTDNSGEYTFSLLTGATRYQLGDTAYALTPSTALKPAEAIVLSQDTDWQISFRAAFDTHQTVQLLGSSVTAGKDGFKAGSVSFDVPEDIMRSINSWTIKNENGQTGLYRSGKLISSGTQDETITIDRIGGDGCASIYDFSISRYYDEPESRVGVFITGDAKVGSTLEAQVTSPYWDMNTTEASYQWLRNGLIILGANEKMYTPVIADYDSILTCQVTLKGSTNSASSQPTAAVTASDNMQYPNHNDAFSPRRADAVTASVESGAVERGTAVTLTAGTGQTIQYSIDNGNKWNDYTGPIVLDEFPVTIQAYAAGNNFFDGSISSYTYTMADEHVSLTGIEPKEAEITLDESETVDLEVIFIPENATNKTISFVSSDTSVAVVTEEGKVSAISEGTANITATSEEGGHTAVFAITVKAINKDISLTGIAPKVAEITIEEGETANLEVIFTPENATNKTLSFLSSNVEAVTVDNAGKITAVRAGTANITATSEDGGHTAVFTVTVTEKDKRIPLTGIEPKNPEISLEEGASADLEVEFTPENATNKNLIYESSDTQIVSVDENGKITALAAGSAEVTATSEDGGYTAVFTITVTAVDDHIALIEIQAKYAEISVEQGKTTSLEVVYIPADATNKNLTYESSDPKIASVDENGIVTGLSEGTAVITVTSEEGGHNAFFTVSVTKEPLSTEPPTSSDEESDTNDSGKDESNTNESNKGKFGKGNGDKPATGYADAVPMYLVILFIAVSVLAIIVIAKKRKPE